VLGDELPHALGDVQGLLGGLGRDAHAVRAIDRAEEGVVGLGNGVHGQEDRINVRVERHWRRPAQAPERELEKLPVELLVA
jgi:hypothetical protein